MPHLSKKLMKVFPNFTDNVFHSDGDVQIVTSTSEHAAYLQHHLRDDDITECELHGVTPWKALHHSLYQKDAETWTGIYKGVPAAMFGVVPTEHQSDLYSGTIWMLGTDVLSQEYRKFLRLSKQVVEYLNNSYDVLDNVVPIKHTKTIQWLAWLGFVFMDTNIVHINGHDCVRFVRCAPHVEVTFQ